MAFTATSGTACNGRLVRSHCTAGGRMACVRRLIAAFALTLVAFALSPVAFAGGGTFQNQSAAFSACVADAAAYKGDGGDTGFCRYLTLGDGTGTGGGCPFAPRLTWLGSVYQVVIKNSSGVIYAGPVGTNYQWCVHPDCSINDSGYPTDYWGGAYDDKGVYCYDGCMSVFHGNPGIYQGCIVGGNCVSQGHFSGNGNRCGTDIDASLFSKKQPPMLCDHGGTSCYNPQKGFCTTTEYGEQFCEPAPPPGSGACQNGATGSTCVGNNAPPPPPSDPPIAKGSSPDSSSQATGKDTDGTTNNYTQNNYSGTSPGSGGPSSGSSSGGGSQSNANGNGNSSGPSGDKGTGSDGKCSDGSVPTASGCSGTFTDTGCNTPPQCFGDAVLCGNAKENWATRCATQKLAAASASSSANYGTPGDALAAAGVPNDGGASGDPSSSGLVSSSDLGSDGFDSSGLGMSRTCPANPSFSFQGHTFELDLTPFCNFSTMFGWFVLLISYLVGLRIVATGKA